MLAAMTELFAADFCRQAEERIGNWTINLKADAARQWHLHREAEDDIVRKLILLLPKFDVLSTVRDAMRIVEELASDGDRLATASEFRRLRDYVLIEVARSNGQRSGGALQMTVDEFHRSSVVHGHRVVHVACHKTWTTYGLIGGVSSPRGDVRDGAIRYRAADVPVFCSRLPAAAACRRLTSPPG